MIGQEAKKFVAELPADRLDSVRRACWRSVDKWEVSLFAAGKSDASESDRLRNLTKACGLCVEFFNDGMEDWQLRCSGCPLFVGDDPCYIRGTYEKIYNYLEYGIYRDLNEEFLGWVKEYGEQLIAYLRELITEIQRGERNGTE